MNVTPCVVAEGRQWDWGVGIWDWAAPFGRSVHLIGKRRIRTGQLAQPVSLSASTVGFAQQV